MSLTEIIRSCQYLSYFVILDFGSRFGKMFLLYSKIPNRTSQVAPPKSELASPKEQYMVWFIKLKAYKSLWI